MVSLIYQYQKRLKIPKTYTCILPEEVLTELLKLNIHKSSGLDGISSNILKIVTGRVSIENDMLCKCERIQVVIFDDAFSH
jgi:hypothetical protein